MNIKNYFLGACAALAFTACTGSEDIAAVQQPVWNEFGNGYLSFSLNLPADKVSRANDDFDNGSEFEYQVKDAGLLIFKGTSEATAVYEQFVNLENNTSLSVWDKNGQVATNPGSNVTMDKKYLVQIQGMEIAQGENFYVLAVLNHNKVFSYKNAELNIAGTQITPGVTTFPMIQDLIVNTNVNANGTGTGANAGLWTQDGGILMLNAPLYDKQGSTTEAIAAEGHMNILQNATASIKPTQAEAAAAPSAKIYVERAVAKVSVQYNSATGSTTGFSWEMKAWRLDNTNKQSYVLRNMANFPTTYTLHSWANNIRRMVGGATVKHNQAPITLGDRDEQDRYRTYFAIDPNYDTNGTFNQGESSISSWGTGHGEYCAENVFDVNHQIWGQTTRVLVSAQLTPNGDDSYYARPGDDKYLSKESVKQSAFNVAIVNYREYISDIRNAAVLKGTIEYAGSNVTIDTENHDKITVTLNTDALQLADGVDDAYIASKLSAKGINNEAQLRAYLEKADKKTQEVTAAQMGVRHYNGGISYYQIRIKHFGDDLTPWNGSEYSGDANAPQAGGADAAYPMNEKRDANYLGRYGVLRNNWYLVKLSGVVKIGYPTLDDLKLDGTGVINPNTPDDHIDKEQWISGEINVLSWAKRTQNNDLGND